MIGTDDELWEFHESNRHTALYKPKTEEFVVFSIRGGRDPSRKPSRSEIDLHSYMKMDMGSFKSTVQQYYKYESIGLIKKCIRDGDTEKLEKNKKFLKSCGVEITETGLRKNI